jgi:hypothetical protein
MALPEKGSVATNPPSGYSGIILDMVTEPAFPGNGKTFNVPNSVGTVGVVELGDLCSICTSTGLDAVNVNVPSYRALSALSRNITALWCDSCPGNGSVDDVTNPCWEIFCAGPPVAFTLEGVANAACGALVIKRETIRIITEKATMTVPENTRVVGSEFILFINALCLDRSLVNKFILKFKDDSSSER